MNYQGQKLKDCKPTSPQLKKKRQRQENSLGELTKNFIDFVRAKGSEEININDIVKKLKVKKRRIYDITNVLEGIGYIKKLAKNKIIWIKKEMISLSKKSSASKTSTNSITNEREINEIISLQHESDKLDNYIDYFEKRYSEINVDRNYLKNTVSECKTSSSGKIYNKINSNLQYLKNSRSFINKLKG